LMLSSFLSVVVVVAALSKATVRAAAVLVV
jgi:hypothetical protein